MKPTEVHPFLIDVLKAGEDDNHLPLPDNHHWDTLTEEAHFHGLTPLFYLWLKRTGNFKLPLTGAAVLLEERFHAIAAQNMMLGEELQSALKGFREAGIDCVPLRGLALAEELYGDTTARSMGDIDLLVRRGDLEDTVSILNGFGFRQMDRRPGFAARYYYTLKFFKDRHGWIIVEPHWTIAYPPFAERLDMEPVWDRSEESSFLDIECRRLSSEDLLLHLCFHLIHEGDQAPLLHYNDIHRLIVERTDDLDWLYLISITDESGQGFLLRQALEKVKAVFSTPLPESFLRDLPDKPPRGFEGRMVQLLAGVEDVDGRESLAVLFSTKGLRSRFRYLLELLFPSPEFMVIQYELPGRRKLISAYMRRLHYFIREGVKGIIRLILR
jgi:hypothetical protein